MLNVEHMIQTSMPQVERDSWLYRPVKRVLSYLLHEQDFQQFAARYPHLQGLEFVEQVLDYFNFCYAVRDNELERIPSSGRIVIVANHPIGSLDGLALLKLVSDIRPDVKVLANQLLMALPPLHSLLLPVNNMTGGTERRKLEAINQHLASEGALILFPAGEVSRLTPKGIRDGKWHSGFLRLATQNKAPILPIHIAGRNSALFYSTSIFYKPLATLLLVKEMFKQRRKAISLRIGEQIPFDSFANLALELPAKVKLFKKHLYRLAKDQAPLFVTQSAIAHPEDRTLLKRAIAQCQRLGDTQDGKQIYLYQHQNSSPIMREIGRLRELSFRAVGEGTGLRRDIDRYDSHYQQLILWDAEELEIVGAYRLVKTHDLLKQQGNAALYSASLFQLSPSMQPFLAQSVELGRSFVQPKYWGKRSLDYLWYGIGAYLRQHPEVRYLFGGVSLSATYPQAARDLMVYFYELYFKDTEQMAFSNNPYVLTQACRAQLATYFSGNDYTSDFVQLKHLLANMGVSIPTLYKQYSELCEPGGVKFLAFGTDPHFAGCIDGLVLVDLLKLKPQKRARYLEYNIKKE